MSIIEFSEQEQIRRESLQKIREMGINPYPATEYPVNTTTDEIVKQFDKDKDKFQEVVLGGRIMSRRIMGNASFFELQDHTGRIQVYVKRDDLCPGEDKTMYTQFFRKLLDIGDIVGVKGFAFYTNTGQLSVHCQELTLLSKSLRPLPIVKEKDGKVYDAFTDPELRHRQRYVDLIVNDHVSKTFVLRSRIVSTMRRFLDERGFLEVETPILQAIAGGAAARPFMTHHNALDMPLYLRIANELYLKKLIVGGYPGVYEIGKSFRNEGMDRTHNPEFTMIELYAAYKDYHWMMGFMEELVEHIAMELHGTTELTIGEHKVSFARPFRRLTMTDAIKEKTEFDVTGKSEEELRAACKRLDVPIDETMGVGKLIDEIFSQYCEDDLIQPTFIIDYPKEMSPLSKAHRDNPDLTERFELFVVGKELCNAYSELNDPIDQLERFKDQARLAEQGDSEAMSIDMDFVRALEYGMPTCAGLGIGVDRLVMFMTNQVAIQEVLFFPQMRPEKSTADSDETIMALGVAAEWIPVLRKMGLNSVETIQKIAAGKLHNDLCGFNKKNKLEFKNPTLEEVTEWVNG